MEYKRVCDNVWCKGHFIYNDSDIVDDKHPKHCKNCRRYGDNLKWEDKQYEGNPWEGEAHEVNYKITNYNK